MEVPRAFRETSNGEQSSGKGTESFRREFQEYLELSGHLGHIREGELLSRKGFYLEESSFLFPW